MKIITVIMGDIFTFPPVISLLHAFEDMEVESILVTTEPSSNLDNFKYTTAEIIDVNYEKISSPTQKLINMHRIRKAIWNSIDKYYDEKSIIWVVSDVTIKYLGETIYKKNYILHLLELSEELLYYPKISWLKMNKSKLGNTAMAVVVPEYNRAHITKAWWKLKTLPFVLPNKPYNKGKLAKNEILDNDKAREIIDSIGDKKIILYQGIISPERPLDVFIDAVDEFNGEYAFVVMSGGNDIYCKNLSPNYYFIPFVAPPNHLQITSHAHIGVLSYVPTYSTGYSPLNSLYCAPNKTFEYSMFGIPMLGNDIPGLRYLFDTVGCGTCFSSFSKNDVCEAIKSIENNYQAMQLKSKEYYSSCDYKQILGNILKSIKN